MAHEVSMNINDKLVLHKDIEIEVRTDGKKLGTALVSKGNIEWLPAGNSVNKFRMSWENFAKTMETGGRQVKAK